MQENKISRFPRNDEFGMEAKTWKSRRLLSLNPGSVEIHRVELDSASRSAVSWRTDLGVLGPPCQAWPSGPRKSSPLLIPEPVPWGLWPVWTGGFAVAAGLPRAPLRKPRLRVDGGEVIALLYIGG